ncbi:hypothetical protein [Vulcanisaeta distributa]|uniref:2-thiouridine synthetase TtuA-like N-terminal LIM domain-containing protein n=1 Tax=Vulcanisaeta distributa (strain DSM 14429 / JCM 11212 / NBRC 100878 / IC-017) TaxID=572478 RepID=E1QTX9_VULDI|nr:hypothetical protein [Vulcanisaeta distributa]ADN49776.1 hypothetical protein Vdis_0372 [Vulcanisaeta distributa DSM 14429]
MIFRRSIRAGDVVRVVRESILDRCSVYDRRAFVRIPYARLTLCKEHFIEFVRRRIVRLLISIN